MHIYIERERERESDREKMKKKQLSRSIDILLSNQKALKFCDHGHCYTKILHLCRVLSFTLTLYNNPVRKKRYAL